ncbi:MAG: recombinase family protein [Myxococcaceae bacterium]|nr:recombinase family protein [Myxococcaceae bacterium]MCI0670297.1 recombinase family protein [Myxococcaceae bacterium]
MSEKILPTHTQRRAAIYLRQSTLKQVHQHQESTQRQYGLRERALQLGWSPERIDTLDEDLGQSGSSASWRPGFQRLAEAVAHGRVGAIFALEVSRLARSSADWHRLLELCGLADVVIVDEQSVYSPRDFNDRLLLGLKGTMSEAEQYWMRLRLEGGRLSKARRGELYLRPAAGYEWDAATRRFRFDPDERVQRAIHLVFELFRIEGSAYAVVRRLARAGLRLPTRHLKTGEVIWKQPKPALVLRFLHNPVYAGAYVFGRSEERMGLVDGQLRRRLKRYFPREAWKTCLRERHPAYISWEEYMSNQRKLEDNRTTHQTGGGRGAAREGRALLQGLVLCGRCGHPMRPVSSGSPPHEKYQCMARRFDEGVLCFSVPARAVDEGVAKLFLETVQPPEVDLSLAVVREAERQGREVDLQWKARLERVRYEAQLAERRYKAVDPDNRVVARTLEREWNERLKEVEQVEEEYEAARRREKLQLSEEDRSRLLALARNLPAVWKAPTTTNAERKNLLRMLVRTVTLTPVEMPERQTRVQVLWHTGAVSEVRVPRPNKLDAQATSPSALERIVEGLHSKESDEEIAQALNGAGMRTGAGLAWDAIAVRRVRYAEGLHRASPKSRLAPRRRADGMYSLQGVAWRLDVAPSVVRQWRRMGLLEPAEGSGTGHTQWFVLDRSTLARLEAAKAQGRGLGRHRETGHLVTQEGHHA